MQRLVLAAIVLCSSLAHAQPGLTPALAPPPPPPAPVEEKNPATAVALSIGVTTAGFVTMMAGADDSENAAWLGLGLMFIGPSTGRWYAGETSLSGLGLRALGAGAMLYGFVQILGSECDYEYEYECDDDSDAGGALMLAGAGLWIGSTIADIVLARRAAIRHNERRALTLTATSFATPSGTATGLALGGRF